MKEIYKYSLEVLGIVFISAAYPMALEGVSRLGYLIISFIGVILYMIARTRKDKVLKGVI